MMRRIIEWCVALILAAIFFYAAAEKIADPREFASSIRNYKFLPPWSTNLLAIFLPWWELVAAVALLIPARSWRRAGAISTLIMGIMFVIAVVRAIILGLDISCGCFGHEGSSKVGLKTLGIDAIVLATSGYLIWSTRLPRPAAAPATAGAPAPHPPISG